MKYNKALQSKSEVEEAVNKLAALELSPHGDYPKNWDAWHMLEFIRTHVPLDGAILDAGGGMDCPVLLWLARQGYQKLYGCDLAYSNRFAEKDERIHWSSQDLTATNYPDAMFDAITCLSVIEHGVDIKAYAHEMARLLKPGGYLLTSTDYWHEAIDCQGLYPYGPKFGEMRVFTPDAINELLEQAKQFGLHPISELNFETADRVVHWQRMQRSYTFLMFILKKNN